ncbi:CDP-alcohol phosphatidyltransferase family protein [Rhodophyticola porphyridii]|uniref:CDP-alcohol phosphatidyltransferase family protein n=1 Tax=Rhodophyticola porphyridii TaxID=1852017 RepID=A0A3L9XW14_9RHOB|nr:CDP-alcohol phosphatidyltransferase family protein [Rhodophyticola porphyridii]RMA40801.1 CDP-alcohol phosphatidyltransferase family protein [Rhodophyticola porphyridii]
MTSRRPIASRNVRIIQGAARRLAASDISANQISQASIGFAALAAVAFWLSGIGGTGLAIAMLLLAALAVQLRLLCNLLDGMVAIEGGKSAPDGPFWNEAPDRLADILILAGLGMAAGNLALGLVAATLAVTTAYLRELGRAEGAPADFSGPMAKPHRMAAVTLGAAVAAIELAVAGSSLSLRVVLWIIIVGALVTVLRRAARLIAELKSRS